MNNSFKQDALNYHAKNKPGKISISTHKDLNTQYDLALAYSPGVAEPVKAIIEDKNNVYKYTNKGNLVAIITDGSAVLGLGNTGALASKPVMEGKAALFKKFAGIDAIDIEVNTSVVDEFIQTVKNISPSFGGINLEDISAPRCFEIETRLIESLDIPVFHDDQHGTAIIIAAGLLNALEIQGKSLKQAKMVCLGAGSAGIATLNLLSKLGLKKENLLLVDKEGVINTKMTKINKFKCQYARNTDKKSLADALIGADILLGVASANLVNKEMINSMANKPIIFALSNPNPEINPEDAFKARNDLIIATGRSDYPNQVNNVLCFPFLFKGALKARAKIINLEMKLAAVTAIQELAKTPVPSEIKNIYPHESLKFGKDYIIPKPFDVRLDAILTDAVYQAAIETKAARI